jgi:hypothetical protein
MHAYNNNIYIYNYSMHRYIHVAEEGGEEASNIDTYIHVAEEGGEESSNIDRYIHVAEEGG